jgi:hypothetical protein
MLIERSQRYSVKLSTYLEGVGAGTPWQMVGEVSQKIKGVNQRGQSLTLDT